MFAVNDRAVINLPGNSLYHNQVVRILKVFPHENAFAARVRFASGGERTLTLDKLLPFTPPVVQAPALPEPTYTPVLPAWASAGTVMRRGCDLKPGDTVYFSAKANPRLLDYPVSDSEWKGYAVVGSARYSTSIYVTAGRWYVVKSKAAR
jgi:hypothetical protein